MPDDKQVIAVNITADAASINAVWAKTVADIRAGIVSIKQEMTLANAQLKQTSPKDLGTRDDLRQLRNSLSAQLDVTKVRLEQLTGEWDAAAARIAAAQKRIGSTPAGQEPAVADQQELASALAAQQALPERLANLKTYATAPAAAPEQATGEGATAVQEEEQAKQEAVAETTAAVEENDAAQVAADEEAAAARAQAAQRVAGTVNEANTRAAASNRERATATVEANAEEAASTAETSQTAATATVSAEERRRAAVAETTANLRIQLGLQEAAYKQSAAREAAALKQLSELQETYRGRNQSPEGTQAWEGYTAGAKAAVFEQAELERSIASLQQRLAVLNGEANETGQGLRNMYARATVEGAVFRDSARGAETGLVRLAAQSKILGPIMAAAFPTFAVLAFLEILVEVGQEAYKVYQNFFLLKEVQEEMIGVSNRLADAQASAQDRIHQSQVRALNDQGKFVAAAKLDFDYLPTKSIDLSKFLNSETIDKKLKELPEKMRDDLKSSFSRVEFKDLDSKIEQVKKHLDDANAAKAKLEKESGTTQQSGTNAAALGGGSLAGLSSALLETRGEDQQKYGAGFYKALYDELRTEAKLYGADVSEAHAKVGKAQEEEAKKGQEASNAAKRAYREAEQALRDRDENLLSDQQADHQLSTAELIAFWERQLSTELKYTDRVREIRRTLGQLHQEQDRQNARSSYEATQTGIEGLKRPDESPDFAAQEDAWRDYVDQLRAAGASIEQINAAMKEAEKAGAAALKQADEDAVKADEERLRRMEATQKLSEKAIEGYWFYITTIAKNGSLRYREAVKNLEEAGPKDRSDQAAQATQREDFGLAQRQSGFADRQQAISQQFELSAGLPGDKKQELIELRQLHADEEQAEIAHWARMREIDEAAGDTKKVQADAARMIAAMQNANRRLEADNMALTLQMKAQWDKYFDTVNRDFGRAVGDWLSGQKNFKQSMEKMWDDLVKQFADMLIQMALKWAENKLEMLLIQRTTDAAQVASTAASQTEAAAITQAATEKSRFAKAKDAAAGAWDSLSSIPVVGPVLGAAAAAATFTAIMAFEKGGIVPNAITPALLHPNEMVLPQNLSQGFQRMLGNGGGGTGDTHLHYAPQVNSYGAGGMKAMLEEHSDDIHSIVRAGMKSGALPSR